MHTYVTEKDVSCVHVQGSHLFIGTDDNSDSYLYHYNLEVTIVISFLIFKDWSAY